MALVLPDRVQQTGTANTTVSFTLVSTISGFQSFASVGDGNSTYYAATDTANNWEVGVGTYTASGTLLTRSVVLSSSNSGSAVTFVGTVTVFVTYPGSVFFNPAVPSAIGGTTPAAGTFTTLTATGQASLGGAAGANNFRVLDTASTVNYWSVRGGDGSSTSPRFATDGTGTNIAGQFATKGTGAFQFVTNNAQEQFRVAHTASAVNYVQVTGAATSVAPQISAQGSDINVNLNVLSKGTGYIGFTTNVTSNQVRILHTANANYITLTGSASGSGVVFGAGGSDTNIDLTLTPKGTGVIQFGSLTANADAPITGYITIKDSGGTVRKLAVIA